MSASVVTLGFRVILVESIADLAVEGLERVGGGEVGLRVHASGRQSDEEAER